ncbi:MAG: type II toxin-antitoxin system HicB family antitoxin [Elusimicrobiota bacterium]|nr:MAG: type II toxin-antitoxin system HicB family antitoxin [Elusimicrobiota bacterium]
MTYSFSAVVNREGRMFVALCPEFDIASQGRTAATATKNLKDAVRLYLETASPAELEAAKAAKTVVKELSVAV